MYRYNLFDDTIDRLLIYEPPSKENLYSDDQMLLHSNLRNYVIVHSLFDMIVMYDLPLDYNLLDDRTHNHSLNQLLYQYGSLSTVMADVNLIM